MNNNLWQLQEAKSKFSELVKRACSKGAQIVTRHGKRCVVVLPYEEYEQLTGRDGSLVQFLLSSPLAQADLSIERLPDSYRSIDIEP